MKNFKVVTAIALASILGLSACQRAEAAPLPLDASITYVDNKIIDEEGVGVNLGTEVNNVQFGLTTFSTDERLESFGAYAGVPIRIHSTRFTVTPQIRVERYRQIEETVGGIGLGVDYNLTETLRLGASGIAARGFDNSDIDGEIYSVGLTKTF